MSTTVEIAKLTRFGWNTAVCTIMAVLTGLPLTSIAGDLPTFDAVKKAWVSSEVIYLDRNGLPIQEARRDLTRRATSWVPLGDVSSAMVANILNVEDRRFYEHSGVDWIGGLGAVWQNLVADKKRGASTLSMQLLRWIDPSYSPKLKRRSLGEKFEQAKAAKQLEKVWDKQQILEAYLNLVPYRGDIIGIDAISRALFDKKPIGLNSLEALVLAVLVQEPNAKPVMVANRACAIAKVVKMPENCQEITSFTKASLVGGRILPSPDLAPLLVTLLPPTVGSQVVQTTLQKELQTHVNGQLESVLRDLQQSNVTASAVLVMHNKTGEVLAYSALSTEKTTQEVDGVQALRQAGSTLKPFVYGVAFEKKLLTPAALVDDSQVQINVLGGAYTPENYDKTYTGLVSVRTALASSLNMPAVRTVDLLGEDVVLEKLEKMGFEGSHENGNWYGPALALGAIDVSLWNLTNAYRALANKGTFSKAKLQLDPSKPGRAIKPTKVLSPQVAFLVGDILSDRNARYRTFGWENALATPYWTAVKTGTSKDMRDNWCIGYSSEYTVGVWVGNYLGEPMHNVSGVSGAAPVWRDIMDYLHASKKSVQPSIPQGVVHMNYAWGGQEKSDYFLKGTVPPGEVVDVNDLPLEIRYPQNGSVYALDPNIPSDMQKLQIRLNKNIAEDQAIIVQIKQNGEMREPPLTRVNNLTWETPLVRGKWTLHLKKVETGGTSSTTGLINIEVR